jgi:ribonuclease P protein component
VKRSHRLLKDADFQNILSKKKIQKSNTFLIYGATQNLGHVRVGLSVSKKLGPAVVRNKIRRQLRMMLTSGMNLNDNMDLLIVVRSAYLNSSFLENKTLLLEGILALRRKLNS